MNENEHREMPARAEITGLIATLEKAIAEVSVQDAPSILGDLARLKASVWTRLVGVQAKGHNQVPEEEDRLLTCEEAAQKLGFSTDWLYRNSKKLPFTVRPGKRALRFSAIGIERYIRQRQGR